MGSTPAEVYLAQRSGPPPMADVRQSAGIVFRVERSRRLASSSVTTHATSRRPDWPGVAGGGRGVEGAPAGIRVAVVAIVSMGCARGGLKPDGDLAAAEVNDSHHASSQSSPEHTVLAQS